MFPELDQELESELGSEHEPGLESGREAARSGQIRVQRDRKAQSKTQGRSHSQSIPEAEAQCEQQPKLEEQSELVSTSVGEIRRKSRHERMRETTRHYFLRFVIAIGLLVALLAAWAAVYNSRAFTIEEVVVAGVEHLTNDEMAQLANVPADTTLLRVDTEAIEARLLQNSWVDDVHVKRVFPSTLEIDVTEREVAAIVEILSDDGSAVKMWMVATDHVWLMPVPDQGTEAAESTNPRVFEDVEAVRHIVSVPYGTSAQIGQPCADENINNALDILDGMTTGLADQVTQISAPSVAETTLVLESGVEIAFGKAEDIRDKERVISKILEDNPEGIAYINVRMVENPTWRSV